MYPKSVGLPNALPERFAKPLRHMDVPPRRARKCLSRQRWRGFAAPVCLQTAAGYPVLQTDLLSEPSVGVVCVRARYGMRSERGAWESAPTASCWARCCRTTPCSPAPSPTTSASSAPARRSWPGRDSAPSYDRIAPLDHAERMLDRRADRGLGTLDLRGQLAQSLIGDRLDCLSGAQMRPQSAPAQLRIQRGQFLRRAQVVPTAGVVFAADPPGAHCGQQ